MICLAHSLTESIVASKGHSVCINGCFKKHKDCVTKGQPIQPEVWVILISLPHLVHVTREEVNSRHTRGGASYADSPCQAMNRQSPQLLARSILDILMIHLC